MVAKPTALIPAIAQSSSLSPVSPEMPTAPTTSWSAARMSAPPGDGIMCPCVAVEMAATKVGNLAARSASSRVPKPIPSAPKLSRRQYRNGQSRPHPRAGKRSGVPRHQAQPPRGVQLENQGQLRAHAPSECSKSQACSRFNPVLLSKRCQKLFHQSAGSSLGPSTLKFTLKREREINFAVIPLEGLWWVEDMSQFSVQHKETWLWTMMMMPDYRPRLCISAPMRLKRQLSPGCTALSSWKILD